MSHSPKRTGSNRPRAGSIDALKVISAFAVVLIHTKPFEYSASRYGGLFSELAFWNQAACRFAVPCFFMMSSYFFGLALRKGPEGPAVFRRYFRRILSLVLFWCAFYALFTPNLVKVMLEHGFAGGWARAIYWDTVLHAREDPLELLTQGTAVHLWFLIYLLLGYAILYAVHRRRQSGLLYAAALSAALVAVFAGTYRSTPWGVALPFRVVSGSWLALSFLAAGYAFSRRSVLSGKRAALLLFTGLLFHAAEAALLRYGYDARTMPYGPGSFLTACGLVQCALAKPSRQVPAAVTALGRLTPGIYALHIFVLHSFLPFQKNFDPLLWDCALPFVVFAVSAAAAGILGKNPQTEKYVS